MTTTNCPSCGASIEFAIGSSAVVVCSYCNSIVARTDRGPELHGIAAALIDTGSPLRVGVTGRYQRVGFRITGRTQMRHAAGGVWDEWHAAFDDGRWGWIAEAQGRFTVTFAVAASAPPYAQLQLGGSVPGLDGFVVAEIGGATLASAEGELPWVPESGYTYQYADLTGPERRFATIDYSEEPPVLFKGAEVSLSDLGIDATVIGGRRIASTALNCSKCGGALELRAPDSAERIWCPYCGAGHDVTAGKLRYFGMLSKKGSVEPVIPLGAKGTIDGVQYVVAGFMQRSVKFDRTYYWTEYLLYEREHGYRWLVHSDDHWSFVTPLRPGDVVDSPASEVAKNVSYGGKRYRLFQDASARVTYVLGEFYWKVEQGETVDTVDYVAPPFGISKEVTRGTTREVAYSHARYMTPKEVEAAFGVPRLPRPAPVGSMQPFPGGGLGRLWAVFMAALLLFAIANAVTRPRRVVVDKTWEPAMTDAPADAPANSRLFFTDPFELGGRHNVEVSASANVNDSWMYVGADLVNEASGRFESFDLPVEYYSGVDEGERWQEGSREKSVHLSRPDKGRYAMRVEVQWEQGRNPPPLRVVVREGVFRWPHFLVAALALSALPLVSLFRRISWESQRWKESAHSPFAQFQSDEDEE